MNTRLRKQMERASRVAVFCREHPSDHAGYQTAVASLEERLARASAMAQRTVASSLATREAVAERTAIRDNIVAGLQLLVGIARTAGTEAVGAPIVIRFPGPHYNQVEFLTGARLAVATAMEREELLVKFGLPDDHLESLTTELNEFERLLGRRDEAGQSKVAALQELRRIVRELRTVVMQLHSMIRFRFRNDDGALRAWVTAADIRIGPRKRPAVEGGTPATLTLPPGPAIT